MTFPKRRKEMISQGPSHLRLETCASSLSETQDKTSSNCDNAMAQGDDKTRQCAVDDKWSEDVHVNTPHARRVTWPKWNSKILV